MTDRNVRVAATSQAPYEAPRVIAIRIDPRRELLEACSPDVAKAVGGPGACQTANFS